MIWLISSGEISILASLLSHFGLGHEHEQRQVVAYCLISLTGIIHRETPLISYLQWALQPNVWHKIWKIKKKKKKRSETATRRYGRLYSCVGIKKMLDILPAWSIKLSENRKCYKFPPSRHTQLPCTHMPVLSGRQSIFFLFVETIIQDWMIE